MFFTKRKEKVKQSRGLTGTVFRGYLQRREELGDEEKQNDQGWVSDEGAAEEEQWKELSGLGKNKHKSSQVHVSYQVLNGSHL